MARTTDEVDSPRYFNFESYLSLAITTIDSKFGDGYAKKHPELIVGFLNTVAAFMIKGGLERTANTIELRTVKTSTEEDDEQVGDITALRQQVGKLYGIVKDMEQHRRTNGA